MENSPSLKLHCVKEFPTLTPSASHYKGLPWPESIFDSYSIHKSCSEKIQKALLISQKDKLPKH